MGNCRPNFPACVNATPQPTKTMKIRTKEYLKAAKEYFQLLRAKWKNEEKQKTQTHLHQKRLRHPRPVNVNARRNALFKLRFNIQ